MKHKRLDSEVVSAGLLLAKTGQRLAEAATDQELLADLYLRRLTTGGESGNGDPALKEALGKAMVEHPFLTPLNRGRYTGVVKTPPDTGKYILEHFDAQSNEITEWMPTDDRPDPVEVQLFKVEWPLTIDECREVLKKMGWKAGSLRELALIHERGGVHARDMILSLGNVLCGKVPLSYGSDTPQQIEKFDYKSTLQGLSLVLGYRKST